MADADLRAELTRLTLAVETIGANVAALMGAFAALPDASKIDWETAKGFAGRAAPMPLAPQTVQRASPIAQAHLAVMKLCGLADEMNRMRTALPPR